jgi:hypothetical protein
MEKMKKKSKSKVLNQIVYKEIKAIENPVTASDRVLNASLKLFEVDEKPITQVSINIKNGKGIPNFNAPSGDHAIDAYEQSLNLELNDERFEDYE